MRQQLTGTRSAKKEFRPQVELLEDRTTPTVTAILTATSLTITGTNKNDVVRIVDGGNAQDVGGPAPIIQVFSEGALVASGPSANITTISFTMKKGNDRVVYNAPSLDRGFAGSLNRTITGNLGQGDDSYSGGIAKGEVRSFALNVSGGKGDDYLSTNYAPQLFDLPHSPGTFSLTLNGDDVDDILTAVEGAGGPSGLIGEGDTVTLNLNGGNDDDVIGTFGFLDLDDTFNYNADGGNGNDTINANLILDKHSGFGIGSLSIPSATTSALNTKVTGGKGKDNLTLVIVNNSTNASSTASLDGGPDKDKASTVGSNVMIGITNVP